MNFTEMSSSTLPPNTGPAGSTNTSNNSKNLSHVPCKFFRQGACQAGSSCPFSHNLGGTLAADKLPCKYFQKGNCKFGLKCALAHFLPDGTRVNSKSLMRSGYSSSKPIDIGYRLQRSSETQTTQNSAFSNNVTPAVLKSTPLSPSNMSRLHSYQPQQGSWQGSWGQSSSFNTSPTYHLLSPNIHDHSTVDYDDDEDAFFEDYVPGSLGDLILTPQEMQKRDSRSQSGTLLVRPVLEELKEEKLPEDVFLMD